MLITSGNNMLHLLLIFALLTAPLYAAQAPATTAAAAQATQPIPEFPSDALRKRMIEEGYIEEWVDIIEQYLESDFITIKYRNTNPWFDNKPTIITPNAKRLTITQVDDSHRSVTTFTPRIMTEIIKSVAEYLDIEGLDELDDYSIRELKKAWVASGRRLENLTLPKSDQNSSSVCSIQ
jgi:hypothetical protein